VTVAGPRPGGREPGAAHASLPSGIVVALSPWVCRIVAPNPGPMTGPGTNTYLVGDPVDGPLVVIDPGPDDEGHLDAVAAAGAGRIGTIVCTHTHLDHWPGTPGLVARTGAEVAAHPGAEGLVVDRALVDGDVVADAGDWRLVAVHTPGHASNHLCFLLEPEGWLFTGDHVMDGSTVVIRPPDGDMTQYLDALDRIAELGTARLVPGHGEPIDDPAARLDGLRRHRLAREAQVEELLVSDGPIGVTDLAGMAYPDVPEVLVPMAQASTWAHLRRLAQHGRAVSDEPDEPHGTWRVS